MDLAKLKQMYEQSEQYKKDEQNHLMHKPIDEWNSQLNSDKFENNLQNTLENELSNNDRLSLIYKVSYDCYNNHYYDLDISYIALYGNFTTRTPILYVKLDDYKYNTDNFNQLSESMYNKLKDKLEDFGFIIIKEDGEINAMYDNETEITIYLKIS